MALGWSSRGAETGAALEVPRQEVEERLAGMDVDGDGDYGDGDGGQDHCYHHDCDSRPMQQEQL